MSIKDWHWYHWFILIGGVVLLILFSALIYAVLRPQTFVPAPPPEAPPVITGLPPLIPGPPTFPPSPIEAIPLSQLQGIDIDEGIDVIAQGSLTQLNNVTSYPVDFINSAPNGRDLNYYDPGTSRFYRIDQDGVISKISDQIFAQAESIVWAPDAASSVIEFPDGSNILYNFDNNEQVTLPAHWQDFDFSPDSERIAFKSIALDPQERWLAVSDRSGSSLRRIEHLGDNQDIVNVDWAPNNQVVGTYVEQDGLNRSEIFFLGFNGENFPVARVHGLKPEGIWRPDGAKFFYSSMHQDNNFNPTLWIVDGSGESMGANRKRIELQTWTNKCVFADAVTAYCGAPRELPRGAGLIPAIADDISDFLYEVNTETGTVTRLAIPETAINVKSIAVNDDASMLFVHDRFTNTIKRIQIK